MDPKERINDAEISFRAAVQGILSGLWTAMPGFVTNINAANMTVDIQPTIMAQQRGQDGSVQNVKLPLLLDCPIMFLGGGGFHSTYPIKKNDECLVVFASRCIDSWWQSGGIQTQAELRMHDLSDGFAFIGVKSKPNVIGFSSTNARFTKDDGTTYVEVTAGNIVNIIAPSGINLNGVHIDAVGNVTIPQTLAVQNQAGAASPSTVSGNFVVVGGNVTADGVDLKTHVHTGVQPGSGNTGGPTG